MDIGQEQTKENYRKQITETLNLLIGVSCFVELILKQYPEEGEKTINEILEKWKQVLQKNHKNLFNEKLDELRSNDKILEDVLALDYKKFWEEQEKMFLEVLEQTVDDVRQMMLKALKK